jgi:phosphatidate cytidylyltransferase|tara:strand:- start:1328 stop:1984 length:657 start_codon:yes stop_codon:yes gene_type:complete
MNYELINRVLTSLVLLPVLIYSTYYSGFIFIIFLSLIYLLSFYEIIKNTKNLIFNLIVNFVLIFALSSFYYLRSDTDLSLVTIYWILSATFLSDIGGYLFGKIFKGKKLTRISPNKTYSGAVGSITLSLTSLIIINLSQNFIFDEIIINFYQLKYFIITIFISIICQLGDLCVSVCKRKINIKNMSNILPGHGGVLDRIDGLIFVLIFSFVLKKIGLI